MSATVLRCRQCGAPLLALAVNPDRADLCFGCGGTALALLPATVEAASAAGPGRLTTASPPLQPDGPRRLLRDVGVGSLPAFLLVLGTFLLLAAPRPRSEAAAPDTTAHVGLAVQEDGERDVVEMLIAADLEEDDSALLAALQEEPLLEGPGDPLRSLPFWLRGRVVPAWMDARPPAEMAGVKEMAPEARRGPGRRDQATEAELLRQLAAMPDVGLSRPEKIAVFEGYAAALAQGVESPEQVLFRPAVLLTVRPDFVRLPVRQGRGAVLNHKPAAELQTLSKKLHQVLDKLTPKDREGHRPFTALMEQFLRTEVRGQQHEWLRPEAIPTLLQVLMHEDTPVRLLLVQLLGEIADRRASVALAQRAVFDLSHDVREQAVELLRTRPLPEFRHVLLDSLRYPWLPVADHAAEALIALSDKEAVPPLLGLLKELEAQAALPESEGRARIREVVRLKHVDNCMTCHPPALTRKDPLTGAIPDLSFVSITARTRQTANLLTTGSPASPRPLVPPPRPASSSATGNKSRPASSATRNSGDGGNCPSSGGSSAGRGSSPSPRGGGRTGGGGGMMSGGGMMGGGGGSSGGGGSGGGYGGSGGSSTTSGSTTSIVNVPGHPGMTMAVTRETQITRQEIPVVIRADITYFRQDFSVTQPITTGSGTEPSRFDFLVRTRPLTSQELRLLKKQPELHPAHRQRETVLFALRQLTGQDAGPRSEEWLAHFPEAGEALEAARLCHELIHASSDKQAALLGKIKEQNGARTTQALATAIPQLPVEIRAKARQTLVERLARIPPSGLRDKLAEDDPEIRRAAVLACVKKEDRTLIPDLIGLLDDGEAQVGRIAHASLTALTGQDHPDPSAWRSWWSEQQGP